MPKYTYVCNNNEHAKNYTEHREANEPMIFSKCECGSDYIEVTE
jgi:hypothetical protein